MVAMHLWSEGRKSHCCSIPITRVPCLTRAGVRADVKQGEVWWSDSPALLGWPLHPLASHVRAHCHLDFLPRWLLYLLRGRFRHTARHNTEGHVADPRTTAAGWLPIL